MASFSIVGWFHSLVSTPQGRLDDQDYYYSYHLVIGVSSFEKEISRTHCHTGVQGYVGLDLNLIEVYHGLQSSAISGVKILCSDFFGSRITFLPLTLAR